MMRKLLNKIFSAKQSKGQLIFAGSGLVLGLLLLLISTQLYLQIAQVLDPETSFPDYLIISKKIGIGNTLTMGRANFSSEEIEDLKKQGFVKQVGTFTSNQFEVVAHAGGKLPFYTELFFEAVPDNMLGDVPPNFRWHEGSDFLPVIISLDMLNLYNFGYALAKGLPQLPKSAISMVTVKVKISGPQGERTFDSKIVGFSERISSVLVPENFMAWANQKIGFNKQENPSRLIVQVKNPSDPTLGKYFQEKSFQTNQDKLNTSKIGGMMQIVMSIVSIIGVFFIALAFIVFTMNFKIVLAEAKEEIKLLLQLGYTTQIIRKHLLTYFLAFVGILVFFTSILTWVSIYILQNYLIEGGLAIEAGIKPMVFVVGIGFITLIILLNTWFVGRLLNKNY